jgi:ribosomal-protein-alanine N-acetyltransferase
MVRLFFLSVYFNYKTSRVLKLNFTPFPTLSTERLVLRQIQMDDADVLFDLRSNENVNKYLDREKPASVADVRKFIEKLNQFLLDNESILWAISLKNDPALIGIICLWNISKEHHTGEAGFELQPSQQRKGYMQEALEKVISYGSGTMQLKRIDAWTHAQNKPAIKLLQRNLFTRNFREESEHQEKGELGNNVIYSLGK